MAHVASETCFYSTFSPKISKQKEWHHDENVETISFAFRIYWRKIPISASCLLYIFFTKKSSLGYFGRGWQLASLIYDAMIYDEKYVGLWGSEEGIFANTKIKLSRFGVVKGVLEKRETAKRGTPILSLDSVPSKNNGKIERPRIIN